MFFRDIPVKLQCDFFRVLAYKMYHKMCSLLEHTDKMVESQIPGQMLKAKHTGNDFSSPKRYRFQKTNAAKTSNSQPLWKEDWT